MKLHLHPPDVSSPPILLLLILLESVHYSTQCRVHDLARGLNSSRSSLAYRVVAAWGRLAGVTVSVHPHIGRLSVHARCIPFFCIPIMTLHRASPVWRRFRLDQVGHASLEPRGSDSLGTKESLCGVVWRWLDQRGSLRVRAANFFFPKSSDRVII